MCCKTQHGKFLFSNHYQIDSGPVSCGSTEADSCGDCPVGEEGEDWCSGDCKLQVNMETFIQECVPIGKL